MRNARKGCGSGTGYQTWGNGKVGAYCCHAKSEIDYIGSLTDPSAHPYVYTSRGDAENACLTAGFKGLCAKDQIAGFSRCAAGWTSDWKGYWFHKTHKGCGNGVGFRGWSGSKIGAYCCGTRQIPQIKYIGDLDNTEKHPYVYANRDDANTACKSAGYQGLCTKAQISGFERCAAGWLWDFKGYWMLNARKGCGSGTGYQTWGDGKVGAYCCHAKSEIDYIGSLTDPKAHPYVYTSRGDAENACKTAGFKGLCAKDQIAGFSRCAAGWTSDWKGYWFHKTHKGCGNGVGFRGWSGSKIGAYCCGFASKSAGKYIGSVADPSLHPYVYGTRSEAQGGCEAAGYKRLCYQSEIEGASKCAAGWFLDGKGYWCLSYYSKFVSTCLACVPRAPEWSPNVFRQKRLRFHKTLAGCGHGQGWRPWSAGKAGAYCCQLEKPKSMLPLCKAHGEIQGYREGQGGPSSD